MPTLLGEVLFDLGIDGRGEGGITAIDTVDLRGPEVAVVADTPAPVADLGQPLGFSQYPLVAAQGLFGLLVLLIVLDDGDEVIGLSLEIPDQGHRQCRPDDLAPLAQIALLQGVVGQLACQHPGDVVLIDEEIVRVGDLLEAHAHELIGTVAQHVAQALIDPQPSAIGGDQGDADCRLLEGDLEAVFALLQAGLGADQFLPALDLPGAGVVDGGAEQADEHAVGDQESPLHQILTGRHCQLMDRGQQEIGGDQGSDQGAEQAWQQAPQQGADDDGQHEEHQQRPLAKGDGQLDPDLQHQDGQQQGQQADAPALGGWADVPQLRSVHHGCSSGGMGAWG
ncbi:hypothetical protein D3C80_500310 [compost metagenome]